MIQWLCRAIHTYTHLHVESPPPIDKTCGTNRYVHGGIVEKTKGIIDIHGRICCLWIIRAGRNGVPLKSYFSRFLLKYQNPERLPTYVAPATTEVWMKVFAVFMQHLQLKIRLEIGKIMSALPLLHPSISINLIAEQTSLQRANPSTWPEIDAHGTCSNLLEHKHKKSKEGRLLTQKIFEIRYNR